MAALPRPAHAAAPCLARDVQRDARPTVGRAQQAEPAERDAGAPPERLRQLAPVGGARNADLRPGGDPGEGLFDRGVDAPAVARQECREGGKRPALDVLRRIVPEVARPGLLLVNQPRKPSGIRAREKQPGARPRPARTTARSSALGSARCSITWKNATASNRGARRRAARARRSRRRTRAAPWLAPARRPCR